MRKRISDEDRKILEESRNPYKEETDWEIMDNLRRCWDDDEARWEFIKKTQAEKQARFERSWNKWWEEMIEKYPSLKDATF